MARKTPVQLVGGAYSDDALPWSAQDCVNYIPVFAEKEGTRSPKMLRGAPGWSVYCATMANSPIRGVYDCEGLLLAVAGNTLYSIDSEGAATSIGTIPGTERVTFAHNQVTGGHQVAIGNGQSGYVYDTSDSSFVQITDEGFPGFRSVDFIDQFIIGVEPFGRYWLHSDLSDATSYNTIDRNIAEKLPDKIQQVIGSGSDVFVLGGRSAQFFYNTGATTGTFANRPGTEMDIGAASPWTACRLDNTVYWLGHDGTVYRLEGNQPRRVSTHALEQAFSRADTSQAYAYTFEDRGHKIYYLTVGGKTWGFDVATGEWHRRKSHGLDFLRFTTMTQHRRRWFGGDYTNGKLYLLDWALQDEAGDELERSRISPVLHDDQNRAIVNLLELVFDTGMDSSSSPLPIALLPELSISGDLGDGEVGDAGTYQYVSSGGTQPHTFSILSGSLPPGAPMDDDGLVTYDYTTEGSNTWTVRVTDAQGNTADLPDSNTITAPTLFLAGKDGVLSGTQAALNTNINPPTSGAEPLIKYFDGELFYFSNANNYVRDSAGVWQTLTGLPSGVSTARDLVKTTAGLVALYQGDRYVYLSTDGRAFSQVDCAGVGNTLNASCIMQVGDTLCIDNASPSGLDRKSTDGGITWANGTFRTGLANFNPVFASATDGNTVVAVGAYSNFDRVRVSTDGMTSWSDVATPSQGASTYAYCAFNGSRFLILKNSGVTATSTAGSSGWAVGPAMAASVSSQFKTNRLCPYYGRFVMADAQTVGTAGAVAFQTDGIAAWANVTSTSGPVIGGTSIAATDGD